MTDEREEVVLTDDEIVGMVETLEPDWTVLDSQYIPRGTDSVVALTIQTDQQRRQVVLKAMTADHMESAVARGEPRLIQFVSSETEIPVPTVYGYCDDHSTYPAPFFLMSYVEGANAKGRADELSPTARDRIVREAGRNIAALHELGHISGLGRLGYVNGEIQVVDPDKRSIETTDILDLVLESAEETLDTFETGGYFPDLADEPDRFADLVSPLRAYLRETIPALPEPDPPTYCNGDYRYGNLLVDPETGETYAVVDWGMLSAHDPAHNIAIIESHLTSPAEDGTERTRELRTIFREAYADARDSWTFDAERTERIRVYRLLARLNAMACLPLWFQDEPRTRLDEREQEHRAFVSQYLSS